MIKLKKEPTDLTVGSFSFLIKYICFKKIYNQSLGVQITTDAIIYTTPLNYYNVAKLTAESIPINNSQPFTLSFSPVKM